MQPRDLSRWSHEHDYADGHAQENERKSAIVVALTAIMMVVEIICGWLFNSMALLADGWHMATHTLALGIGVFAYRYARLNAHNPAYSFGTGKVHALGAYTSALFLAVVAVFVLVESVHSVFVPKAIHYNEAIAVAVIGLAVNSLCIWLLHSRHDHAHGPHQDHDINRKAAYAHVVVDAMTSIFAIIALLTGKYFDWAVMDPIVGIVGAIIIGRWSLKLIAMALDTLLDRQPGEILDQIRHKVESDGDSQVVDLHVWQVAPGRLAAIISVVASGAHSVDDYKSRLREFDLAHVTIELNPL